MANPTNPHHFMTYSEVASESTCEAEKESIVETALSRPH
jgi:hypothetical protein